MKLCPTELGCVVNDPVTARAAGEMFEYGGKLMRVSQDCSEEYGKRLNFLEVDSDFSSYYREKTVKTVDVKDLDIIGIKIPCVFIHIIRPKIMKLSMFTAPIRAC